MTALALGALLLLGTACSGGGNGSGGSSAAGDPKAPGSSASATADTVASTAVVSIAPGDGADDVATTGTLKVAATGGKLSSVVVKDDKGTEVPGEISADGLGWTPTGPTLLDDLRRMDYAAPPS